MFKSNEEIEHSLEKKSSRMVFSRKLVIGEGIKQKGHWDNR